MVGFSRASGRLRAAAGHRQHAGHAFEVDFGRTVYPWRGCGNEPRRVIGPCTGVIAYPPSGGMILYLHMSSFLATGQAVWLSPRRGYRILNFSECSGDGDVHLRERHGTVWGQFSSVPLSSVAVLALSKGTDTSSPRFATIARQAG